MTHWPIRPLKSHISEVSLRKGETEADILSVTNTSGFVRSLDVFDKQVFSQDTSNYKLVKFNDIAYNPSRINVGSVARCHLRKGGAVSPMYVVVRCRESLLPQYLLYFLKSDIGMQHINHRCVGAVRVQLRFSDLEQIELPIPPLPQQKRIIEILDEADKLHRLRAGADQRTNELIPAIFYEMFGDPILNSKDWPNGTLGDLGLVVTGNTPPRNEASHYGDFIEWIKTDNINPIRGTVERAAEKLSETGALRGRVVPTGSVLITCIAGSIERIGDAAITDREVAINQQINAIIPKTGVENHFVGALVCALKPLIQASATGVMTRIINKTALEGITTILPPKTVQVDFAQRLGDIRNFENSQAIAAQKINDLLQSMLQRAFQGQL